VLENGISLIQENGCDGNCLLQSLSHNVSTESYCEAKRQNTINGVEWYCILESRKCSMDNYYCASYQEIVQIILIKSTITVSEKIPPLTFCSVPIIASKR
jgi:hypothetical protein